MLLKDMSTTHQLTLRRLIQQSYKLTSVALWTCTLAVHLSTEDITMANLFFFSRTVKAVVPENREKINGIRSLVSNGQGTPLILLYIDHFSFK